MLTPRKIDLEKIHYKIPDEDPDIINAFIQHNETLPSCYKCCGPFVYNEVFDIIKEHFKDDELLQEWELEDEYYRSASFKIKHNGTYLFMKIKKSYMADDNDYVFSKKKKYKDPKYGWLITGEIDFYYSIKAGKPMDLIKKIKKTELDVNNDHNKIGLICQDSNGGLFTKDFPILKKDYAFDLELHYGTGFQNFHDITVKRIDDSEKGIILLHGVPGSGKSFYIRRLIRDLMRRNKKVLYMPNNMVDLLGTPSFNNFLLEYVEDSIEDGNKNGLLMIIEDAEKVLIKRADNPYGATGVSNILNSTDGILNDFLNVQVLCTFNCSIDMIDEAILRKKRAISVKEFEKLSVEDSQKLIDHLALDFKADKAMSLADIYSIKEEAEDKILFPSKKENNKIGFGN